MKITTAYFSATYTTRQIVREITACLTDNGEEFDLTNEGPSFDIQIPDEDLLIVGIPVYAGRVPAMAVERVRRFKGSNTPAMAVAVYGNRDYDDALVELYDILTENGFKVVSAGAFIAQHSIFPKVGENRPDQSDIMVIKQFAEQSAKLIQRGFGSIQIKGNRPYKIPGSIPIWPTGSSSCKDCGKCVRLCPVGAITLENPCEVDQDKCIKCGRCIVVCPSHSRAFRGEVYEQASEKFNQAFAIRREPELFYAE